MLDVFLFETANIVEIFWNFAEVKATVMDHYYWNHLWSASFYFVLGVAVHHVMVHQNYENRSRLNRVFYLYLTWTTLRVIHNSENGYSKNRTCSVKIVHSQSKTPPAQVESVINKSFKFWSNWGSIVLRAFVVWNGSFVIS